MRSHKFRRPLATLALVGGCQEVRPLIKKKKVITGLYHGVVTFVLKDQISYPPSKNLQWAHFIQKSHQMTLKNKTHENAKKIEREIKNKRGEKKINSG